MAGLPATEPTLYAINHTEEYDLLQELLACAPDSSQSLLGEGGFVDFSNLVDDDVIFVFVSRSTTPEPENYPSEPVSEIDSETLRKNATCVVCKINLKCMMYTPCRHVCVCKNCSKTHRKQSNKCPLCNVPYHDIVLVYAHN